MGFPLSFFMSSERISLGDSIVCVTHLYDGSMPHLLLSSLKSQHLLQGVTWPCELILHAFMYVFEYFHLLEGCSKSTCSGTIRFQI